MVPDDCKGKVLHPARRRGRVGGGGGGCGNPEQEWAPTPSNPRPVKLGHLITAPTTLHLAHIDPNDTAGLTKDGAETQAKALGKRLDELEDMLFYAGRHAALIVLQGMDTSGKDGTIRFLLQHINAQSADVSSFKVPTIEELAHDFLWRIHRETPARGSLRIFNRSHYEDVGVVRVHDLAPWQHRFDAINAFEKLLADNGTIILKFFLHIDLAEQEKRLLEREQEVEKAWKLSVGDWKEREHWAAYQEAYGEAIGRCAAPHAPWVVVPANKKWFRNLVVLHHVVEALGRYEEAWRASLAELGAKARAELEEYRRHGSES